MLRKINQLKNNHEEGFTLVELIVVIVIIGILAAIAVPMYLNNRKQAIDAQTKSNTDSIAKTFGKQFYENPDMNDLFTEEDSAMRNEETEENNGWMGERFNDGTKFIATQVADTGYCVLAWNEAGGDYTSIHTAYLYDSTRGGVTDTLSLPCDETLDDYYEEEPPTPTDPVKPGEPNTQCLSNEYRYMSLTNIGPNNNYIPFAIENEDTLKFGLELYFEGAISFNNPEVIIRSNKTGQILNLTNTVTVDDVILYDYKFTGDIENNELYKALSDGGVTLELKAVGANGVDYSFTSSSLVIPSDFATHSKYCITAPW